MDSLGIISDGESTEPFVVNTPSKLWVAVAGDFDGGIVTLEYSVDRETWHEFNLGGQPGKWQATKMEQFEVPTLYFRLVSSETGEVDCAWQGDDLPNR